MPPNLFSDGQEPPRPSREAEEISDEKDKDDIQEEEQEQPITSSPDKEIDLGPDLAIEDFVEFASHAAFPDPSSDKSPLATVASDLTTSSSPTSQQAPQPPVDQVPESTV